MTGLRLLPGILQQQAKAASAGASFDPSGVGWEHYWYAEGSEFEALGLADAATVSSWPDEVGTLNAATTNGTPEYKTSGVLFGKPVIRVVDDQMLTAAPSSPISQPYSLVAIAAWNDGVGSDGNDAGYLMDSRTSSGRTIFGGHGDTGFGWMHAGTALTTTPTLITRDTPQLMVAYFAGGSSELDINEALAVAGNAGSSAWNGATFFNRYTSVGAWKLEGEVAFLGVYDGDVRSDPGWADFVIAASEYYGLGI